MAYLNYPGKQPGPGTELVERINWQPNGNGLGCADCGGTCGGFGIFDGTWGIPEYAVIGLGVFALFSMISTTTRGARRVAAIPSNRRKAKAARLRKQADDLTRSSKKK